MSLIDLPIRSFLCLATWYELELVCCRRSFYRHTVKLKDGIFGLSGTIDKKMNGVFIYLFKKNKNRDMTDRSSKFQDLLSQWKTCRRLTTSKLKNDMLCSVVMSR